MRHLSTLEKTELATIPALVIAGWFAPLRSGTTVETGTLLAGASLLLLVQGFFRDAWLWLAARQAAGKPSPQYAQCMCVESALGLTGIAGAAGLTAFGLGPPIPLTPASLALGLGVVLGTGFGLKDFVFEWFPWKIYRVKNHASLHFRWKK